MTKAGVKELVLDANRLKVYGEENERTHGNGKGRTWRKLHIGLDPNSHEIVVQELKENCASDAQVAGKLLTSFGKKERVYGDGAYDDRAFRQAIHERGAECIVPQQSNATYKEPGNGWIRARDITLAEMKSFGGGDEGRDLWKKIKEYHRRSLGETAFFRIKTIFGEKLRVHSWEVQRVEAYVKYFALNIMTGLGMPRGEWVEIA